MLRQDQFLFEEQKIINVALMGNTDLWNVMAEREELLLANAEVEFDAERFSVLEDEYQRQDGYAAEAHASAILEGLGLPSATHHDPLSTLSGGFKLRVLLAQVLASSPDVLLLTSRPTTSTSCPFAGWKPSCATLLDRPSSSHTTIGF